MIVTDLEIAIASPSLFIWNWIFSLEDLVLTGFKYEVVRQAVWESLATFAAIVNAACEDDLEGEVTYLIII